MHVASALAYNTPRKPEISMHVHLYCNILKADILVISDSLKWLLISSSAHENRTKSVSINGTCIVLKYIFLASIFLT